MVSICILSRIPARHSLAGDCETCLAMGIVTANISVQSDAGKFRICELNWDDQAAASVEAKRRLQALPVAYGEKLLAETERPIYLRRGAYFEAINSVLAGDFDALTNTVFCETPGRWTWLCHMRWELKSIFWIGLLRSKLTVTRGGRLRVAETVAKRVLISPAFLIGFDRTSTARARNRRPGRRSCQTLTCQPVRARALRRRSKCWERHRSCRALDTLNSPRRAARNLGRLLLRLPLKPSLLQIKPRLQRR